jgi:hypothetical protein
MIARYYLNGVARQIRCAYIGVDGKAQYILKPNSESAIYEMSIYKKLTELVYGDACYNMTFGAIDGRYVMFAGGYNPNTNANVADTRLVDMSGPTITIAANLPTAVECPAPAEFGSYLLLIGGYYRTPRGSSFDSTYVSTISAYDKSGTLISNIPSIGPSGVRASMSSTSSATVGKYLIISVFGSSYDKYNKSVNVYDSSFTKVSAPDRASYYAGGAASVGNYAIFSSPYYIDDSYGDGFTEVYDYNLTKSQSNLLSYNLSGRATISGAEHAIFAGGYDYDENYDKSTCRDYNIIDIISPTLSRTTTYLPNKAYDFYGAENKNFILFGAGSEHSGAYSGSGEYGYMLYSKDMTLLYDGYSYDAGGEYIFDSRVVCCDKIDRIVSYNGAYHDYIDLYAYP